MGSQVVRAGALALAVGMGALVVGHAGLSGCRGPSEAVTTPSAETKAASVAPKGTETSNGAAPASSLAGNVVPGEPPNAGATISKPAPSAPRFMGASKAAPVFRDDDVEAMGAKPQPALQQASKPQMGNANGSPR